MSLSQRRWVSVISRALLLVNHDLQILSDGPASAVGYSNLGGRHHRVAAHDESDRAGLHPLLVAFAFDITADGTAATPA